MYLFINLMLYFYAIYSKLNYLQLTYSIKENNNSKLFIIFYEQIQKKNL